MCRHQQLWCSRVWSCGSDCKRVVEAAWRGFNVQVSEGESNLEALGYSQDPLLQQVGAVGLRVPGGVDLPVHLWLWADQPQAATCRQAQQAGQKVYKQRVWTVYQIYWSGPKSLMKATPTTIAAVKHRRGFIYGRLGRIHSSKNWTLLHLIVQMTNSQRKSLYYGQISELGKNFKQTSTCMWDKQISFQFNRNSPGDEGNPSHPASAAENQLVGSWAAAGANPSPTNEALTPQSPLL